ncbi:junctional adhesion molecule-like [Sorex araneus]|uniref:junctional adhesion molecule-like n=1 Tax=Sorex araneus TaxID=42254 RepID=UPI002433516F|nr:junctional adhesion molecule-like [Sorex araneus]
MFRWLKLALLLVLFDAFWGLHDWIVASRELVTHVGDSVLLGCFIQNSEEKPVVKVDWILSSEQHTQEEYVLFYYSNLSVPTGRFQHRAKLVGNISGGDGSLLLQNVQEADQGTFTCEIRVAKESQVWKKAVRLRVLPAEPRELTVQVGGSTQMGCAFQSTEESPLTEVEWSFSSGEQAQEEVVLPGTPGRQPQDRSRFQNRVSLAGAASNPEGAITLHGVRESDGGSYTCSVHLGGQVLRKTSVLHVALPGARTLVTAVMPRPEALGGNHLVMLVGIVCATILLLPVLLLLVVRRCRCQDHSMAASTKSLENTKKALPEKHVYAAIVTPPVVREEEPSRKLEAEYMTMRSVWPQRPVEPPHSPAGGLPRDKLVH